MLVFSISADMGGLGVGVGRVVLVTAVEAGTA